MQALLSSGRHAHLALSAGWEGQQQEAWRTATLFVRHFSPGSSSSLEAALCLLHVCLALQLLLDPPSKTAAGMVGELAAMQKDLTTAGQGGGGTGTWCEALTDMLLSLLCQPSSLCREVASQVFRMTMAHQTRQSLELLIGVRMLVCVCVHVCVCVCVCVCAYVCVYGCVYVCVGGGSKTQ